MGGWKIFQKLISKADDYPVPKNICLYCIVIRIMISSFTGQTYYGKLFMKEQFMPLELQMELRVEIQNCRI